MDGWDEGHEFWVDWWFLKLIDGFWRWIAYTTMEFCWIYQDFERINFEIPMLHLASTCLQWNGHGLGWKKGSTTTLPGRLHSAHSFLGHYSIERGDQFGTLATGVTLLGTNHDRAQKIPMVKMHEDPYFLKMSSFRWTHFLPIHWNACPI